MDIPQFSDRPNHETLGLWEVSHKRVLITVCFRLYDVLWDFISSIYTYKPKTLNFDL